MDQGNEVRQGHSPEESFTDYQDLVVRARVNGCGCELMKILVLSGFKC
jgi:hypothetical protein